MDAAYVEHEDAHDRYPSPDSDDWPTPPPPRLPVDRAERVAELRRQVDELAAPELLRQACTVEELRAELLETLKVADADPVPLRRTLVSTAILGWLFSVSGAWCHIIVRDEEPQATLCEGLEALGCDAASRSAAAVALLLPWARDLKRSVLTRDVEDVDDTLPSLGYLTHTSGLLFFDLGGAPVYTLFVALGADLLRWTKDVASRVACLPDHAAQLSLQLDPADLNECLTHFESVLAGPLARIDWTAVAAALAQDDEQQAARGLAQFTADDLLVEMSAISHFWLKAAYAKRA